MKYLIPIIILGIPLIVFAQCQQISSEYPSAKKLCTLVSEIAVILKWFGIALALVIVILSGIQYMTSAGDEEKAKKARKTLTNGLIGVAIVFAAYFLVGLVEEFIMQRLI
jgi:hypothetical protein